MFFGKSKINNVDLLKILAEYEVRGLDVPVNEASVVDLLDGHEHLDQQLDCNLQAVVSLQVLPYLGEVVAQQVHHNKILLAIFNEVIHIAYVFQALKVREHVVLEYQDALVFVLLFYFQGHVFLQLCVEGLVDETESALAQFLLQIEPLGYF